MRNLCIGVIGFVFFYLFPAAPGICSQKLTIVYTGDMVGHVLPCGCSVRKGGLARQAGKIRELQDTRENVILVDCGNMINKSRPISEARARIIIEGISRMHYDAVNLSGGELELGVPFLKNLLDTFPIQFVSTNIGLNPSQWEKIADTYIIKEVNGVKVAITGVSAKVLLNDDVQKDKNVIISSPISTLKPVLSKLKDQVDLVILLSQMTIKGTKNFLTYNALPEVGVVIAGHGRNLTPQAVQVKDTLVVQNSMGGEYLSVLNLELDDSLNIKGHSVEIIPLTDEVPEDPVLLEKMKQFKATTSKIQAKSHKTEQQLGNQKELLQLSPEAFIKYQSEMENK